MLAEPPESTWPPHVRPLLGDLAVCGLFWEHQALLIILSEYKLRVK